MREGRKRTGGDVAGSRRRLGSKAAKKVRGDDCGKKPVVYWSLPLLLFHQFLFHKIEN
jgi:hypothetical protein